MALEGWDLVLAAISGYVAITTLVRLMRRHHERLVEQLLKQAERERQRLEAASRQQSRDRPRPESKQRNAA